MQRFNNQDLCPECGWRYGDHAEGDRGPNDFVCPGRWRQGEEHETMLSIVEGKTRERIELRFGMGDHEKARARECRDAILEHLNE